MTLLVYALTNTLRMIGSPVVMTVAKASSLMLHTFLLGKCCRNVLPSSEWVSLDLIFCAQPDFSQPLPPFHQKPANLDFIFILPGGLASLGVPRNCLARVSRWLRGWSGLRSQ